LAVAGTSLSADAAAPDNASKPSPADALPHLKRLSDAKEVVLYQYEVCPFCNKV
jgi:hypothetical protein